MSLTEVTLQRYKAVAFQGSFQEDPLTEVSWKCGLLGPIIVIIIILMFCPKWSMEIRNIQLSF